MNANDAGKTTRLKLLARAITAASVLLLAGGLVLSALNDFSDFDVYYEVSNTSSYLIFSGVGLLIISRQPTNLVGWICALIGFFSYLSRFSDEYATYAYLTNKGALPFWQVAAPIRLMIWVIPVLMPPLLLPALFPDGKPLSQRWAYVSRAGVVILILIGVSSSLVEDTTSDVPNPLAIQSLGPIVSGLGAVLILAWVVCFLGAVVSAILRFRRSTGQLRLQMKWFAYTLALAAVLFLANDFVTIGRGDSNVLVGMALSLLPISIGISVLRYNLYEIDRIISRTLVYGLLTAGLGAVYLGLVVGLQALLQPLSSGSDLAIVATTLVVAALFLPARSRVQTAVDRRFNRRSFDASRTVETFALRLRDQIDLDTLRYELLAVVDETMQPASASLWLRAAPSAGAVRLERASD